MIKKIVILMLVAIFFINIGFGVEYLNSCGKTSGWTNGETYIINFTLATLTNANYYSGSSGGQPRGVYCLRFDIIYHNITIESAVDEIVLRYSTQYTIGDRTAFIGGFDNARPVNLTIQNLRIRKSFDNINPTYQNYYFALTGNELGYDRFNFYNVTLIDFDNLRNEVTSTSPLLYRTYIKDSYLKLSSDVFRVSGTQPVMYFYVDDSVIVGNAMTNFINNEAFFIDNSVMVLSSE